MALAFGHLKAMAEQPGPWTKVTGGGLDMPLYVRLGHIDGRLACTGLVIGDTDPRHPPREVTTRSLRVPLAAIVAEIARFRDHDNDDEITHELTRGVREFIRSELHDTPTGRPRARPGAQGHPDEFYEEVASRYREAVKHHPRSPTKALAAEYPNYEASTVRYWLRVCRQRGLLGRSEPGKGGEAHQ
jgi:hypothetical protein